MLQSGQSIEHQHGTTASTPHQQSIWKGMYATADKQSAAQPHPPISILTQIMGRFCQAL